MGLGTVVAQNSGELRGDAILDHLNAVIDWYRHAMTRVQTVGLPSDAMYQFNAQSMAAQVAKLAFQSAQAEAALIPAASPQSSGNANSSQTKSGQIAERREHPHQHAAGTDQHAEPADIGSTQSTAARPYGAKRASAGRVGPEQGDAADLRADVAVHDHEWQQRHRRPGRQHQRTAAFGSRTYHCRQQDGSQAAQQPGGDAGLHWLDRRSGAAL